jgi:hypothetical protein
VGRLVSLNPFKNRSLLKSGARGTATVLELDEKALRRHQIESTERVNLKLKLGVEVDGMEPFETEGQYWVKTPQLTGPGQQLPVAVDPKKPKKLAIDWSQPPAGIGGSTGGIEIDLG